MEELECSQGFPHYNLLQWKPEFWSDLAQNLMQRIPHPNDALDERTSDSLNEGLPIKMVKKKFQRKLYFFPLKR